MNVPLRAAIVGAGQISKMHVAALDDTPHAELVAVVDRDLGLAGALAAGRPGVGVYSNLSELLADRAVDAVHVATPPASHASLAIEAMEAGCHALVEKPMCLSGDEADKMLAAARANGVVLSTCHNYQFKPSVAEARRLVREGAIGKVTSVAAVYGVAGEKSSYAGGGPGAHWAWRLPGGVFTNFLPHLIALEQEFLGDDPQVVGVSLTHRGRDETPTELVAVLEGPEASATMTVSLRTKPYVKYLEVFGTRGIVRADLVREVCTISRNRPMPGALSKVVFNAEHVLQVSTGTVRAAAMVALGRWKAMPGLRVLVDDFYGSIAAGRSPEITGEDGRRMVAVLERLQAEIPAQPAAAGGAEIAPATAAERRVVAERRAPARALVTGASGFLGGHLAAALARCGTEVVSYVRDPQRVSFALERDTKVVVGRLDDAEALRAAMDGVDVVFHCAAVTTNNVPWRVHESVNVEGTAAVVAAAAAAGVERVVHVSSVAVYGVDDRAGVVGEDAPLPEADDPTALYQRSKAAAERAALGVGGVDVTVVRPGVLYGPGRPPGVGLPAVGPLLPVMGSGRNRMPYTYVDNAVDALLLAATDPAAAGEVFNVVDTRQLTTREALGLARGDEQPVVVPVPRRLLLAAAGRLERRRAASGAEGPPRLSAYVVRSATRDLVYDTAKAATVLGWEPEVSPEDGFARAAEE